MSNELRPIHDPEVRQQHRRQLRSNLRTCAACVTITAGIIVVVPSLLLWGQYLLAEHVPVTVVLIDRATDTVTVASSAPHMPTRMSFEVDDATHYAINDRVDLLVWGEPSRFILEREPALPLLFAALKLFTELVVVGMVLGTFGALCIARQRSRALRRPWRRARVDVFSSGADRYALISAVDGGSAWKLADAPIDLQTKVTPDAQIAGTAKHLVIRFFGSTQLARARRVRALPDDAQPTGESAMSSPRCTSVGVSDPRSSSSCLASRK
jgi:hypothetical protein